GRRHRQSRPRPPPAPPRLGLRLGRVRPVHPRDPPARRPLLHALSRRGRPRQRRPLPLLHRLGGDELLRRAPRPEGRDLPQRHAAGVLGGGERARGRPLPARALGARAADRGHRPRPRGLGVQPPGARRRRLPADGRPPDPRGLGRLRAPARPGPRRPAPGRHDHPLRGPDRAQQADRRPRQGLLLLPAAGSPEPARRGRLVRRHRELPGRVPEAGRRAGRARQRRVRGRGDPGRAVLVLPARVGLPLPVRPRGLLRAPPGGHALRRARGGLRVNGRAGDARRGRAPRRREGLPGHRGADPSGRPRSGPPPGGRERADRAPPGLRARRHRQPAQESSGWPRAGRRGQSRVDAMIRERGAAVRRLRLAFVVQRYGPEIDGGAGYECRKVAEALVPHHEVEVLTTCARDYLTWRNVYPPGLAAINGVRVRRFPVDRPRRVRAFGRFADRLYATPHTFFDEAEWVRRQGPLALSLVEWIRAHADDYDGFLFYTYLYLPTTLGLPLVAHKAILVPTAHDERPIYLDLFKSLFRLPRALVFQVKEEQAFVEARFHTGHLPAAVIGAGVDPAAEPQPERFRRRTGITGPFLLYVGRVDVEKGCRDLVEAFLAWRARGDEPLRLVLM